MPCNASLNLIREANPRAITMATTFTSTVVTRARVKAQEVRTFGSANSAA